MTQAAKLQDCAKFAFPLNESQEEVARGAYGEAVIRTDGKIRPVEDTKYHLKKTRLKYLPMTPLQAMKLNCLMINERQAKESGLLSPSQIEWLDTIMADEFKNPVELCEMEFLEGIRNLVKR